MKEEFAAKAAIEAFEDELDGQPLSHSELRALASAFHAAALYLRDDCLQLIGIAKAIEEEAP